MSEQRPDAPDSDETAIRQGPNDDKTRVKEKPSAEGQSGAEETILRKPVVNENATILREPAKDGSDNATIIRAPTPAVSNDQATMLRGASNENDATAIKPSIDDDATVMNPSLDDDATFIGGGGETDSDTTYIASVGRQIESKGNSEAGRLLKNRFVLEEKMGSGGMGDVYKALDLRAQESQEKNPYIAVKMLNESFSHHKDAYLSLQREMAKTRGIPHKNIMGVYDFDREGDTVFMTMELLTGMPLDDYLKEHPEGVSVEDAWNIIDGISQGLSRAHGAGIVHSDFKPGNIFYTDEKIAKVFDFGIARAVSSPGDLKADGEKTVFDAASLGALTPTYASYEMLKGMDPSKSDDVYAVALVAYELFTGKHPYDRVPADKALERQITPERIPFLKRRHWRALKKALEIKGEDRTQSIDEFHEGMFSEDPPILRFTAIAAVLLASVGFGAYTFFFGATELDPVLQELLDDRKAYENTVVDRLGNPAWTSNQWHDQLKAALNGLETVTSEISENWAESLPEEDLEAQSADYDKVETRVLTDYLAKVMELKSEAKTFDRTWPSVQLALPLLIEAQGYIQRIEENGYDVVDISAVGIQREALEDRLQIRQEADQRFTVEKARQDAAKLAEDERLAAEAERETIAQAKYDGYELHVNNLKEILGVQCAKYDIPPADLDLLGEALAGLPQEAPDWYARDKENITKAIAGCIALKIGIANPKRAREVKARVMAFLPGEPLISDIEISDKDPCTARGLEGRGKRSRSWCADNLATGDTGPKLVVIPELPRKLPRFAISRTEIKVEDYNLYCGITGCEKLPEDNPSNPATNLTVEKAKAYTGWLSEQSSRKYRLPTVDEWQWAVKTNQYSVDTNVNCTVDSRGVRLGEKMKNALSGRPNEWGLYNPVGNAREWAQDSDGSLVALGGAHTDPMSECRASEPKLVAHSGEADPVTGFRILRQIES